MYARVYPDEYDLNGLKNLKETLQKVDMEKLEDVNFIDGYNRNIKADGNIGSIDTGISFRNTKFLLIKNANSKGYLEAQEGDGVDISGRMEHHRGTVQKGKIQTLTTQGKDCGIVVGKVRKIKEST